MKRILIIVAVLLSMHMAIAQDTSRQDRFNQYGRLVSRSPLDVENRNGILVFESKDQDYRLWFDIRVQVDGQIFSNKTMNPIGNGVSIRRARFAAKTNLTKNWYGEIDLDFSNGILELNDAYIQYDFRNGLATRVGNFKERFSMSQTSSSRYLNFLERAMVVTAFTPSRHVGWETSYSGTHFLAAGGVFFQEVEDAEMRTFVEDNNKDYGRDEGVSFTGKFALQPTKADKDFGGHLAYAASYRQPKTSVEAAEYGGLRYSTRSLSSINRKKYLDTDIIPNVNHTVLNNIEIAGYFKGFGFQSEYIRSKVIRNNNLSTLNFNGFYAQAACLLFGGRQFYNHTEAEFSQPYRGKKWGDMELAFRYDNIDMNDPALFGGAAEAYTAGVNIYAAKNVRFQINYSYVNHDRYASGKKKLFVGYDLAGALTKDPTKVADANGTAGEDYGMMGVRFEINF
ncbi:MAG TPA: porin [Chitinophagaceae bacterium]|jgi:phosphate-selective porin OprO/OprP|nr:porin [Chitinophagaceae bacterium]HPH32472.1 porin [Chitinophagaceae bacterium]HPN58601.1 porin [Chitinophagaceae bacterium]HRG23571.1 porin [Chitinophagaceae bacterium]